MTKKCWIIRDWECYVESDEIPLEVCKLCVETRLKVEMMRVKTIRRLKDD